MIGMASSTSKHDQFLVFVASQEPTRRAALLEVYGTVSEIGSKSLETYQRLEEHLKFLKKLVILNKQQKALWKELLEALEQNLELRNEVNWTLQDLFENPLKYLPQQSNKIEAEISEFSDWVPAVVKLEEEEY